MNLLSGLIEEPLVIDVSYFIDLFSKLLQSSQLLQKTLGVETLINLTTMYSVYESKADTPIYLYHINTIERRLFGKTKVRFD